MGIGSSIAIYQEDINNAAANGLISQEQAAALWPFLVSSNDERWRYTWTRLAYAFGTFLIIGSLTWFTDLAWRDATGLELFWLSSGYVISFGSLGYYFWKNNVPEVPQIVGGIFTSIAAALAPVITYSLQRYYNYWFDFPYDYLPQELTELVAGIIAVYFVPFPFITVHICSALYSITENNLTQIIFGPDPTLEQYSWVSIVAGFGILIASYWVDKRMGYDFSFFPYLCGLSFFFGGWTALFVFPIYTNIYFKLAYFAVSLTLLGFGTIIQRGVFLIYGSLGCITFIVHEFFLNGTLEEHAWISVAFGTILMTMAYYYSIQNPTSEFPFWGFFFGSAIFWGGWTILYDRIYDSQYFKFLYFLVNVGLMIGTIPLKQRILFYWGLIGSFIYIVDMVNIYWANSWYLPFILTLIGLAFIALAVYFSNHPGIQACKKRFARKKSQVPLAQRNVEEGGEEELQQMQIPQSGFPYVVLVPVVPNQTN